MIIIRLVLESRRSELFLEAFPIEFGPFFMILEQFEKNRYFGPMAKLQYTGNVLSLPNLKIRPDLLFADNIFFFASNDLQTFSSVLPGT